MATLNLQKKKMMSESNYRRLVNILVGLMASQSTIESQCLTEYEPIDRVYQRGNITIYNGYIWEAKTVAQGTFDESKWTKLADNFTELDLDTIKGFLGLTPEQLTTLSSIIKDDSIELSKTWSSSKSYMEIDNVLKEAKQYCLTQLAKKSTGSFKIASSTTEVTDGNYLYLIMNTATSKYDIYALISGNVEKLTTVDIDLSQYYTKDEVDADFLKKTDATSTYATITTVDGKVDKTSIATATSTTATDEQVYSASVMNTELDKKFDKDNILSIIQDTDNTKVFGAKAVYDTFNQKADKINVYELKDSTGKSKHIVIDLPASHSISGKTTRLFVSDNIATIGLQIWNGSTLEKDFRASLISPNHIYKDITSITPVSSNVNFTNADSSCYYSVMNGICYVNIWSMNITSNLSVETLFNNLPTAKASAQFILSNSVGSKTVGMGWISKGTQIIACNAKLEDGTTKSQGYARFSYPIDESWIPS